MSLASLRTEKAVYWAPDVPDGFGSRTFVAAAEIDCRWQDTTLRAVDDEGVEFVSRATIYPDDSLELHGWLYRGTLASLGSPVTTNPQNVTDAYRIRSRGRSQNPSGGIVVHKILLGGG